MRQLVSSFAIMGLFFIQCLTPYGSLQANSIEAQKPKVIIGKPSKARSEDDKKRIGPKGGEGRQLMSNIALIAITASIPLTIKYCPGRASAWAFVAAGTAYIASEVVNWWRYNKLSKSEELNKKDAADTQIMALEKAGNQTALAAKAAKTRANLAKVAAAGFMIAAGLSITEQLYETPGRFGACLGATSSHGPQAPYNYLNQLKDAQKVLAQTTSTDQSLMVFREYHRFTMGETQSSSIAEYHQFQNTWSKEMIWQEAPEQLETTKSLLSISLTHMQELILPSAHARGGTIISLGIGAAAAALILKYEGQFLTTMSKIMANGFIRAAVFGGYGLLAFTAAAEIDKESNSLNQKAAEYKSLAQQVKIRTQQIPGMTNQSGQTVTINKIAMSTGAGEKGKETAAAGLCFTGQKGSLKPDEKCSCQKTNTCKKSESPIIKYNKLDTQGVMANGTRSLAKSSNALFSGNLSKANEIAGEMGKNAIRISKLNNSLKRIANTQFKEINRKPINWDRLEKAQKNHLIKAVRNGLKGMSNEEKNTLAKFAPALAASSGRPMITEENHTEKKKSPSYKNSALTVNQGTAAATPSNNGLNFSFELEDEKADADAAQLAAMNANKGVDLTNMEVDAADISEKPDVNLFKIITTRYLKSAYPVLFEQD